MSSEGLRLLLEAVRVKDEDASLNRRFLPHRLQRPVRQQVFASIVDGDPLLLDQLQRLDPRPLKRLGGSTAFHFLL